MNRGLEKMVGSMRKERVEEFVIIGGLLAMQAAYAGNSVLLSHLMTIGFRADTLIILSSIATFVILAPFSYRFERSQWPKKIKVKLWIILFLISFGGVTIFQSLLLKGINLTSPAMATAMPNLAPGFIFFIAWACRLEKVKLGCIYSRAKIAGTLLCVVGAVIMSVMQSTLSHDAVDKSEYSLPPPPDERVFDGEKIIGAIYLIAAVFVLSTTTVLQAAALAEFPAPMSLCAITSLIGSIFTAIVELIKHGRIEFEWRHLGTRALVGYSVLLGLISGICVTFNIWAMKKRGPVLVAVFSPIGALISVVLSVITLGTSMSLGSLAGMFIMFSGLYFVLWAKGKERLPPNTNCSSESECDIEKPLLS